MLRFPECTELKRGLFFVFASMGVDAQSGSQPTEFIIIQRLLLTLKGT